METLKDYSTDNYDLSDEPRDDTSDAQSHHHSNINHHHHSDNEDDSDTFHHHPVKNHHHSDGLYRGNEDDTDRGATFPIDATYDADHNHSTASHHHSGEKEYHSDGTHHHHDNDHSTTEDQTDHDTASPIDAPYDDAYADDTDAYHYG